MRPGGWRLRTDKGVCPQKTSRIIKMNRRPNGQGLIDSCPFFNATLMLCKVPFKITAIYLRLSDERKKTIGGCKQSGNFIAVYPKKHDGEEEPVDSGGALHRNQRRASGYLHGADEHNLGQFYGAREKGSGGTRCGPECCGRFLVYGE